MHLTYICPNCDHSQELIVTPPTPAQISGPPERCYPAEDGEFEPKQCEHCDVDFDYDEVMDAAADWCAELKSQLAAAVIEYYDRQYDEGRGGN